MVVLSISDVGQRRPLQVTNLGGVPYADCLQLQRDLNRKLQAREIDDTLLICHHPPVITMGSSTKAEHLLADPGMFDKADLVPIKVERGGSVTYHGPQQVVAYPILNLKGHRQDVAWYMRSLEEVVIRTLAAFSVSGVRIPERTGVWIDAKSKISFIGVKISRWCTFHGLSLNLEPCSEQFALINPCGLGAIKVTSMAEVVGHKIERIEVEAALVTNFLAVFDYA